MRSVEAQLSQLLRRALGSNGEALPEVALRWELPRDLAFGDLATPIAFKLTRQRRQAPQQIAQELADSLTRELATEGLDRWIDRLEPRAGYINAFFSHQALTDVLRQILRERDRYGYVRSAHPRRINVEFVSANPTGPLSIAHGRQAAVGDVLPLASVVERLRPVFEDASIEKVGHNLKYDLVVVRQVGIEVAGVSFDTLLASFILDPTRRSHSLDSLVKELLGHEMIPISEFIGKGNKQISLDQLDTQRVGEYAAEDADFTWRLKELLEPQLAGSDTESLFRETEMHVVEVLAEMEHNGIALDVALLSELGTSLAQRLEELTAKIHEAAGRQFNIDSPKQLAEVLFDELGFEVVRKTKTGRSTDAETLETLAAGGDQVMPRLVLEYRELAKLKSTYVDKLPKMVCARTGRIHASFHLTGAVTGRLSSSDPNLQNIPIRTDAGRRIREAFVAGDPGSVLLAADYSQIELRLLAHFCQDPALVEAFQSGQDIHKTVAAQINGVAVDEVTSEQRSAAKAVNFGIIYGQSPFGLSRALGIPIGEARTFIDTYFMRYPGIRLFIDRCVDDARRTGYAQTILGRRRPIPELRSRNRGQVSFGERIAVNTVVQGSAADLIKRAMIDIHAEVKTNGHGAKMLIQVHDELVFEVPEKHVESAAEMIRRKMENPFKLTIPLVVDIAWGRNWAEAH